MYGAIISGALSLATTLYGQYKAQQEQKKVDAELDKQSANLNDWYWSTKGDKTQRADIMELGRIVSENVRDRNKAAENPIASNTVEAEAAIREQNAQDMTNFARIATSQLAAEDAANNKAYLEGKQSISKARAANAAGKAQQITNAASQASNTFANIAGNFANTRASGSGNSGDASVKSDATSVKTRAVSNANEDKTAEENKAVVNDLVGGQAAALGSYDPDEGDYAPFKSMFGN